MNASEIMQTSLVTSPPQATVVQVARLMTRRRVGACLVIDGGRLKGIFTEHDLLYLVASGEDVRDREVGSAMTTDVTMAPPYAEVQWVADTMRRLAVRHIPVGEDGYAVGIVSIRDLYAAAEAVLRLDPRGVDAARDVISAASG